MKVWRSLIVLFTASLVIGSGISYGKIYLFHVLLVPIFLLTLLLSPNKLNPFNSYRPNLILFLLLGWNIVGLAWSRSTDYSFYTVVYFFLGCISVQLISSLVTSKQIFLKVFRVIATISMLVLIIAVIEVYSPLRWPTSPLSVYSGIFGRGSEMVDLSTYSLVQINSIMEMPTVFWGNTNNLSIYLVMILPFFLFTNKPMLVLPGIISIFLLIAQSQARACVIGALLAIIMWVFFSRSIRSVPLKILFSLVVIFTIIVLMSNGLPLIETLNDLNQGFNSFSNNYNSNDATSLNVRFNLISSGLHALQNNFVFGLGPGISSIVVDAGRNSAVTAMHNFWIELLVEGGIVSLSLFCYYNLKIAMNLYSVYKKSTDDFFGYMSASLLVALVCFWFTLISASTVIYFLPMWLLYGLSTSLIYANHKIKIKFFIK